jgi:hypothetical protein
MGQRCEVEVAWFQLASHREQIRPGALRAQIEQEVVGPIAAVKVDEEGRPVTGQGDGQVSGDQ